MLGVFNSAFVIAELFNAFDAPKPVFLLHYPARHEEAFDFDRVCFDVPKAEVSAEQGPFLTETPRRPTPPRTCPLCNTCLLTTKEERGA